MTTTQQLPEFVRTHVFYRDIVFQDDYGPDYKWRRPCDVVDAQVVSSLDGATGMHRPLLDLDFTAALIESSTPGNCHLYLDKPMSWRTYRRLLRALARAGVIEHGYAKASIRRKHSDLRLPWIRKER